MDALKQYKCCSCGSLHNEAREAEVCCADTEVVYICQECECEYEKEQDANECCTDEE